ncbi:RiPP maturation radical SAM C-methyltransferase [Pseudoalteromonas spongiae]|uniref:RiPP maturation radical SAM C-methyltransferase n=1 Tax=Pseudoalteromonas spongiae TaxID=298657 RepID=UPI00110B390E|nr:RiPP maturation radical SAM C-methyltransferase [Pseudoalteromonas spongiae]TMO84323.1 hypothetical protein CWC15_12015 [Pseudoalteromonas spongiae]
MTYDIVLVASPVLSSSRPALGVSILKSILVESGYSCKIVYANLVFAEVFGNEFNEYLSEKNVEYLLGDWLFSDGIKKYEVAKLDSYIEGLEGWLPTEVKSKLYFVKENIGDYLTKIVDQIIELSPKIVGFSTTFQQTISSLVLAKAIKKLDSQIITCFGGANCEGSMGLKLLNLYRQIDYVFSGESEKSFPAFVKMVFENSKNISFARQVIPSTPTENISVLPAPDFEDYFEQLSLCSFESKLDIYLPIETSRGCWWGAKQHCTFCGLNGDSIQFRPKSPTSSLEQIQFLHNKWGVKKFMAVDNIMDNSYVEHVFGEQSLIDEKLEFFYEIKSNLNFNQMFKLSNAGVRWVQPGIEALNDELLKFIKKGVSAIQNIAMLKYCKQLNIRVSWNLLWGISNEDKSHYESYERILPLIEHLEPPNGIFKIRIDRFSPYFEKADSFGISNISPKVSYMEVFGLSKEDVFDVAYFFDGDVNSNVKAKDLLGVSSIIKNWKTSYFNEERALLVMFESEGNSFIIDTRRWASKLCFVLTQESLFILKYFREPRSIEVFRNSPSQFCSIKLQESLKELVEHNYMLLNDKVGLSLVIDETNIKNDQLTIDIIDKDASYVG